MAAQLSQVLDCLTGVMADQNVTLADGLNLTGAGALSGVLNMKWITAQSAPAGSSTRIYFKSDGYLYAIGTGGSEFLLAPSAVSTGAVIYQNAGDFGKKMQSVTGGSQTPASLVGSLYVDIATTVSWTSTFGSTPKTVGSLTSVTTQFLIAASPISPSTTTFTPFMISQSNTAAGTCTAIGIG